MNGYPAVNVRRLRNGWSLGRNGLAHVAGDTRLLLAHAAADARSDDRGDVRCGADRERGVRRGHATEPPVLRIEQTDLTGTSDGLRAGADA
jgi:hypothetical protein